MALKAELCSAHVFMPAHLYLAATTPAPVQALNSAFLLKSAELAKDSVSTVEAVLDIVREEATAHGWSLASGRRSRTGIPVATTGGPPVLADGTHPGGFALWVETGRSWNNFEFLRHLAEGIRTPSISHAVIAVNERYGAQRTFERCESFLTDLLAPHGLDWPFESVTLIGY